MMPERLPRELMPQGATASPTGSILSPAVQKPQGPDRLAKMIGALQQFQEPLLEELAYNMQQDVAEEARIAASQPLDTEEDAKRLATMVREGSVGLGANPFVRDANRKYQYIRLADRVRTNLYQAYNSGDPSSPDRYTPKADSPDVAMRWARGFINTQLKELGINPDDPDVVAALGPRLASHMEKFEAYHSNIYTGIQANQIKQNVATDFRDAMDEADEFLLGGMPQEQVREHLTSYLEAIDRAGTKMGIAPSEMVDMQVSQAGLAIMQAARSGNDNWSTMLEAVRKSQLSNGVSLGRNARSREMLDEIERRANSEYLRALEAEDAIAEQERSQRVEGYQQAAFQMAADGAFAPQEREALFNSLSNDVNTGRITAIEAQSIQKFLDETLTERQGLITESELLGTEVEENHLLRALSGQLTSAEFMANSKGYSPEARQRISQAMAQSQNTTVNAASHELSMVVGSFRRSMGSNEYNFAADGGEQLIADYTLYANRVYQNALAVSADMPDRERLAYIRGELDRIRDYGQSLLPDGQVGDTQAMLRGRAAQNQQAIIAREEAARLEAQAEERATAERAQQAVRETQQIQQLNEKLTSLVRAPDPTMDVDGELEVLHKRLQNRTDLPPPTVNQGFTGFANYVRMISSGTDQGTIIPDDRPAVLEGNDADKLLDLIAMVGPYNINTPIDGDGPLTIERTDGTPAPQNAKQAVEQSMRWDGSKLWITNHSDVMPWLTQLFTDVATREQQ